MHTDFAIFGDPHLVRRNLDKANQLFQIAEDLGKTCIWLGDFLDTKEIISGKCLNALYRYLSSSKLFHYIIVGNHDWFNLECEDHSLQVLKSLSNVKIIDEHYVDYENRIAFYPYTRDVALLKRQLESDRTLKDLVVIGHFDMIGFDYGNGHFSEDGLTIDDFKGFKRVFSGHYHKAQLLENFFYVGTPFSHTFGETDQEKIIVTYNSETDELGAINTPFPRHVTLKLDMTKKDATKELKSFLDANKGNITRVQLYGTPDHVAKLDKDKYADSNVKWEDKTESSIDSSINLDETLDNRSQFVEWGKNIRKLDADTIKIGLDILEKLSAK